MADEKDKKDDKKTKEPELRLEDPESVYNNVINRLAYIKYLIDDKSNADNKGELKKIYNVLVDLSFKDGHFRSITSMVEHIKDIERLNAGKIPDLPSESVLKAFDDKMIQLKIDNQNLFDTYIEKLKSKLSADVSTETEYKSDSDEILNSTKRNFNKIDDDEKDKIKFDLNNIKNANPSIYRALCLIDLTTGLEYLDECKKNLSTHLMLECKSILKYM